MYYMQIPFNDWRTPLETLVSILKKNLKFEHCLDLSNLDKRSSNCTSSITKKNF